MRKYALALTLPLVGCGSDEEVGFKPSSGVGGAAGADGGTAVTDGGVVWPDADPSPDASPGGTPEFDAGGPPMQVTCQGKLGPKGNRTLTITPNILPRSALLHVPELYDPGVGAMLVLNFHGFGSANWQEQILTRMDQVSDEQGFIVAYPQGVGASWNAGLCCGTAWLDAVDDVDYVRQLIDAIAAEYCIDPKRVYATGMSNGGFMSHRLACELPDKIAAIAPVAGVLGTPFEQCNPGRPIPVLHFHGTADSLVPYGGGTPIIPQLGTGLAFPSVADTLEHWRVKNGCSGVEQVFYQQGDTTCVEWPDCHLGTRTALCTIDGGGHTWPGGLPIPSGKTSTDINATRTMIGFFHSQPLP